MAYLLSRLLVLVFVIFSLPASSSAMEKGVFWTEELQLKVADSFMGDGEYYRAVTEYKKFLYLFPDSERADYALFQVGLAYYRGEEYATAIQAFARVRKKYEESPYAAAAEYFEGLAYWKLGRFDTASEAFGRVVNLDPSSEQAPLALLGKSLVSFDAKDLPGCRRELERFLVRYPEDSRADNVRKTLALLDDPQEVPGKSPAVAGVMSALVPGSGYMYAGRYGDGFTALVVNGLFIAGTVVAVRGENYPVAAIVGGIGLPFYVGNIYGSANAAKKWNIAVRKKLRGELALTLDYHF